MRKIVPYLHQVMVNREEIILANTKDPPTARCKKGMKRIGAQCPHPLHLDTLHNSKIGLVTNSFGEALPGVKSIDKQKPSKKLNPHYTFALLELRKYPWNLGIIKVAFVLYFD